MANQFKTPPEFIESLHPAEAWADWRQRFNIYAVATNLTARTPATQVAIFLHIIGPIGIKLYNNFALDPVETLDNVLAAFDEYYKPYKNITHISHLFFMSKQQDQTIDQYVADLKTKARDCEFGTLTDRLVRDVLICGINDMNLREKLLTLNDPLLAEVVGTCRAAEQSKQQSVLMSPKDAITINAIRANTFGKNSKFSPSNKSNKKKQTLNEHSASTYGKYTKPCYRCGSKHPLRACPAHGQDCRKCGKKNHFANVCRQKVLHTLADLNPPLTNDEGIDYFIGTLAVNDAHTWQQKLQVNGNLVTFKIDTGSDIDVIPKTIINSWETRPTIIPVTAKAVAYSGHSVPISGKFTGECKNKELKLNITFFVIDVDSPPVLSGPTCEKLRLIKRLSSLECQPSEGMTPTEIIKKFSCVFADGLGKLDKTHHITLREGAVPCIAPPRKIPLALLQPVKDELDRMTKLGVIKKVVKPTDWVNALLPLQKNNRVRIALDPRPLNRAICRQHYPIPLMESIHSKLANCKFFTVLDGRDAYWQMVLDEESSYLCTFSTPFGRYRFLRVPYGISPAPEFQQQLMDDLCEGLPATLAFFDDVIIGGRDLQEHNQRLYQFLERAQTIGLKLKPTKTQLAKSKVTFVGHIISEHGLEPSEHTANAINAINTPTSREELQRFLGLVTYIGKFIPNLSEKTAYLRNLLRNSIKWNWSDKAAADFLNLKTSALNAPVLALFNPNEQLVLSVDASQFGIGAVLLQAGKPLAYASATLTDAQRRYAQIEKELLAIVFGCVRFHFYTYGRDIIVETDHKPLLAIVGKSMDSVSPRLQRLVLKLQRYSLRLKHVPGKYLFVADTLSRSPSTATIPADVDDDKLQVHTLVYKNDTDQRLDVLRSATADDPKLQQLIHVIASGWPNSRKKLETTMQIYWNFRNELFYQNGLIYRGKQILIPCSLRKDMLSKIHESHQGIVASKARAREHLFWPGMSSQIEDVVAACQTCQKHSQPNRKEPMMPYSIPARPWERVAVDFLKHQGKVYLLLVDYYSKYIELSLLTNRTNAHDVILTLKGIFSRHGIPTTLISDNGPPFDSLEFRNFASSWAFHHSTSSPTYPQSNGQVERSIKTIKTQLGKCLSSGGDPFLLVLNYNTTPHDNLPPPSVLLMSRRLHTTLPGPLSNYKSLLPIDVYRTQKARTERQTNYYNKGAQILTPFTIGTTVLMPIRDGTWIKTQVIKIADQPRSYWVQAENGRIYRRNRRHLKLWKPPLLHITPKPVPPQILTRLPNRGYPLISPTPVVGAPLPISAPPVTPDKLVQPLLRPPERTVQKVQRPHKHSDLKIPVQSDIPVQTRSGRIVNKPLRFLD